MRIYKVSRLVGLLALLVAASVPFGPVRVQAQGGSSPATAQSISVGACASTTVNGSAAAADAGTAITQISAVFYGNASSPIHDWYSITLDKADNIRIDLTRSDTSARLDLFLFAPIDRLSQHPEGIVVIDFSTGTAGATRTIGPRALAAGRYLIGVRAQTGSSAYSLVATRGTDTTQALFIDHRISSANVGAAGLMFLNKFTPTRPPATVVSVTAFIQKPTAGADPSGQMLRFVVYADPMSTGRPPAGASPVFSQLGTLPMLDYSTSRGITLGSSGQPLGVQITSGDFYAGFAAPNHDGVGLRFDLDGLTQNAGFVSRDNGATFSGISITDSSTGTPFPVANALIRTTVSLPACTP